MSRDIVLAIHYHMRKKGLTQSEVASRLGVSRANVAALLNGKANMTLKSLCDLQDVLGVTVVSVSRPYEAATVWHGDTARKARPFCPQSELSIDKDLAVE